MRLEGVTEGLEREADEGDDGPGWPFEWRQAGTAFQAVIGQCGLRDEVGPGAAFESG